MMRTRRFVSPTSILAVALLAASVTHGADPVRSGVGPLPSAALILPSDVGFVLGFDVKRLMASPIYDRMKTGAGTKTDSLGLLAKSAGIVPERDLTSFVMAGSPAGDAAMLVFGQFDLARIAAAIDAEGKATKSVVRGVPAYLGPGSKGKDQMLLALVSPGMLALGTPARVEAMLAAQADHAQPFLAEGRLVGAVRELGVGSAFWMVGDGNLTRGMAGGSAGVSLPSLESVSVTGDFAPELSLTVTGQTTDATEAKKAADMLRGLIGLAAMQGAQKPELQALASGLVVTNEGARVTLQARVAYDVLDKLMPAAPKTPAATSGSR